MSVDTLDAGEPVMPSSVSWFWASGELGERITVLL